MTFSIIAHDVATGQVGIAVASKTLATGARVPHIRTGVGAIASQARVNRHYGPRGLALLASGASAADTVRLLVATDEEQDVRQVHLMDRRAGSPRTRAPKCQEWCGHLVKETYSVAGNILAGRARARGHGRGLRGGRRATAGAETGGGHEGRRAGRRRQAWDSSRRRCSSTAMRTGRCSTSGSTITPIPLSELETPRAAGAQRVGPSAGQPLLPLLEQFRGHRGSAPRAIASCESRR